MSTGAFSGKVDTGFPQKKRPSKKALEPAAQRVDVPAYVQHGRDSALDHGFDRRAIVKQRPPIAQPRPPVSHLVREQQVQALEYANDGRDSRELILRERLLP